MSKKWRNKLESAGEVIRYRIKPQQKPEMTPVDFNLPNVPIFNLNRTEDTKERIETYLVSGAKIKVAYFNGKPSILGQEIYMAVLRGVRRLEKDGRVFFDTDVLEKDGVVFTPANIADLLGLDKKDTKTKQRIKKELFKLGGVVFSFYERWLEEKKGNKYTTSTLVNLSPFVVTCYEQDKELDIWEYRVRFDKRIVDGLKKKRYRLYNLVESKKLKRPTAKRCWALLVLHNHTRTWKCGFDKFCSLIPIEAKRRSDKKKILFEGLDELLHLDILKKYELDSEGNLIFYFVDS